MKEAALKRKLKSQNLKNTRKKQQTADHQSSKMLDTDYLHLRQEICNTQFYIRTTQHNKIKLIRWFQKLDLDIREVAWKKNRNNYAKLLYLMSMCGSIHQPFSGFPAEGDLPQLPNYQIHQIIDTVERCVNEQTARYGSCVSCLQQKQKVMSSLHNCSTKHSFCETRKESYGDGRRMMTQNSQEAAYFGLYQQLEQDLGQKCFDKVEKGRESFVECPNKENRCMNNVLADRPPKSKYCLMNKSRPKKSLLGRFSSDQQSKVEQRVEDTQWNFDEHQIEENIRIEQVKKSSYFALKHINSPLITFSSSCDEQNNEKISIIQQVDSREETLS